MRYTLEPKKKQIRIYDFDLKEKFDLFKCIFGKDLIVYMPTVRMGVKK